ncbi:MAG: phosphotransferase family protein [Candidatus Heimdallarchaeota archaeon]
MFSMLFYEEKNLADITIKEILPSVQKFLPKIQAESIHFFYHGTYNVFEINNKYILRVPDREFRNIQGFEMLTRESAILDFFQKKFALSIPEILYLHNKPELPFSIHNKIPGKSLAHITQQLTNAQKERVGGEIGRFLSRLHSKELLVDFERHFKQQNQNQSKIDFFESFKIEWNANYKSAQKVAYGYLSEEEKIWLTDIFDKYLNNPANFSFSPRISHCDFDTSNILIDSATTKLTGVIDFEECKIYDPAVDLLFFDEGPIFLNAVLDNYEFSKDKSLLKRMKFFYCRTCAPYLVWGSAHNRPGMIEEGLRRIKKNMAMFPK